MGLPIDGPVSPTLALCIFDGQSHSDLSRVKQTHLFRSLLSALDLEPIALGRLEP